MKSKAAKLIVGAGILLLSTQFPAPLRAQVGGAVLSGTVTDSSGKVVSNAKVSVKNPATGQSAETKTDWTGRYEISNLLPGDYEVSVSAEGISARVMQVTITEIPRQTLNVALGGALSLDDLGFSLAQTQGSAEDQAKLNKRSHMLKIHQELGLITTVPLLATVIAGSSAGGKSTSSSARNVHAALGTVTFGLYWTSAYYAIFAPTIPGSPTHGNIRLHKALAWVHGAGMILTPILGDLAYEQRRRGESVHGIASAHGAVGIVTAVAYGAAILTESLK
jgi:hypothetical protein